MYMSNLSVLSIKNKKLFLYMEKLSYFSLPLHNDVDAKVYIPRESSAMEFDPHNYKSLVLLPEQTHSLNVGIVSSPDDVFRVTDALVTFLPGVVIGVKTADCVPILLYAPDVKGVAAIHAGWKGTLGGIVTNAVEVMKSFGADPSKMIAAFGPSISMDNYEVSHDLAASFINKGFARNVYYPEGPDSRPHIDLQGVNITRLLELGLQMQNIRPFDGCTYGSLASDGSPKFPSHRRTKGSPARLLTTISLH